MMSTMTIDQMLGRVSEMKQEKAEKDEAIREQQMQIQGLEAKIKELEDHRLVLENKIIETKMQSRQTGELMNQLSEALA